MRLRSVIGWVWQRLAEPAIFGAFVIGWFVDRLVVTGALGLGAIKGEVFIASLALMAAMGANMIALRTSSKQLRPHLWIIDVRCIQGEQRITFDVRNNGQTPGTSAVVLTSIRHAPISPYPHDYGIIDPGITFWGQHLTFDLIGPEDRLQQDIWMDACITYQDGDGRWWERKAIFAAARGDPFVNGVCPLHLMGGTAKEKELNEAPVKVLPQMFLDRHRQGYKGCGF